MRDELRLKPGSRTRLDLAVTAAAVPAYVYSKARKITHKSR